MFRLLFRLRARSCVARHHRVLLLRCGHTFELGTVLPPVLAMAVALAMLVVPSAVNGSEYLIQPGDRLRLTIQGLAGYAEEQIVDESGIFTTGIVGDLPVAGMTIEAVRKQILRQTPSLVLRRYDVGGEINALAVDADQINLAIVGYRPITVAGAVENPGRYDYEPNLSVRAVIARAGGRVRDFLGDTPDAVQLLRLKTDLTSQIIEHAEETARIWRLEQLIAGERHEDPPAVTAVHLNPSAFEQILKIQRTQLDGSLAAIAGQHEQASNLEEKLVANIALLEAQMATMEEAADITRREADRLNDAVKRGLARTADLVDAERVAILSQTQRQSLQEQLFNANFALARHRVEHAQWQRERQEALLDELAAAQRRLRLAGGRIRHLAESLGIEASMTEGERKPSIVVYRVIDGEEYILDLGLGDFVKPGDVVSVETARPTDISRVLYEAGNGED